MEERNPGGDNQPGTYRDPRSGAESTVTKNAGADALARMGWKRVSDGEADKARKPRVSTLPDSLNLN